MTRAVLRVVVSGALVCLATAAPLAQDKTLQETKKFRIIAVSGNQLVVSLPEGTRELTVADDFRFNVDGKMLSVRELKAGMAGTAVVTTRTTLIPVTVTEVKNGTVMRSGASSIVVRTGDGIRAFTQDEIDKRGVKIWKDGKPAQMADYREGDQLTATIITSKPPRVMTEQEVKATLATSTGSTASTSTSKSATSTTAATTTAKPAASTTSSASTARPAAEAQATTTSSGGATRKLPATASSWPLVGLVGVASLVAGLTLTARRRRATR